jgi:microcystin-dependent protein
MPAHSHNWQASPAGRFGGESNAPSPTTSLSSGGANDNMYASSGSGAQMSAQSMSIAGGSQPHNNMMPFLTLNFCIALQGIFPSRN